MFVAYLFAGCTNGSVETAVQSTSEKSLWKTYSLPHYRSIYHLAFTSEPTGWATGERGTILSFDGR